MWRSHKFSFYYSNKHLWLVEFSMLLWSQTSAWPLRMKVWEMFVQRAAEEKCADNEHKMFWCFVLVLVDETEKGDVSLPAGLLMFMRWCRVLAGDVSLRIREESSRGWLISQVIGILSSMGQRLFLEPARKLWDTDKSYALLLSLLFYFILLAMYRSPPLPFCCLF